MKGKRLWHMIRLYMIRGSKKRADYARKKGIYAGMGENVTIMDRKVPLYAQCIKFHNNIKVASGVSFVTHDITDRMINQMLHEKICQEVVGCIEIEDNVFIGTNVTILNNVRIGPNAVVAAGSVVNRTVPPNSIVGGVPAKVIGRFDEYVEKRKTMLYPAEMAPKKQEVSDSLVEYLWDKFDAEK